MKKKRILAVGMSFVSSCAFASSSANLHADPIASVILGVTGIFFFAILGRYIARCTHQPGVLGELLIGVLLGNLCYYFHMPIAIILREGAAVFDIMRDMLGGMTLLDAVNHAIPNPHYAKAVYEVLNRPSGVDYFKVAYVVDIFSRYGVIFLLFMVGLESSFEELKHTGKESIKVAILGVIAPILLGLLATWVILPEASFKSSLFIAATLCATSIGITARVLTELNQLQSREAKTILGAAMLDDVLGLIILAVVSSVVISGVVDLIQVSQILGLSIAFFTLALTLGPWLLRQVISFFRFLAIWEAKLFIAFIFVMFLAWIASSIQLATIIGAFTAGLILHDGFFEKHHREYQHHEVYHIKNLMSPLESILAPLFFMLIGIQVKLETFMHLQVIYMALGLLVAAILGKLVSGYGADKHCDRLLVGIGMLPRGEVGLVFASIGRGLGVIGDDLFAAIILMVIVTTFIAPSLLKIRYQKDNRVHS